MPSAAPHPGPAASTAPAWSERELASNPHANAEKAEKVRGMFAAIASRYDLNNRLHSFGLDQAWRRKAVRIAGVKPGDRVLDCACGTGDLTRAFADAGAASVTGLDFTKEMLDVARTKRLGAKNAPATPVISYVQGDAMNLPFADASFDIVSIAFGIRNVTDPRAALREFRRVLKRGGRLVVLEFDRPRFAPIAWANDFYCSVVMPRTATLISGDRSGAYKYLPRSVRTFMSRGEMQEAMRSAGFADVSCRPLTFGVCACFRGEAAG